MHAAHAVSHTLPFTSRMLPTVACVSLQILKFLSLWAMARMIFVADDWPTT